MDTHDVPATTGRSALSILMGQVNVIDPKADAMILKRPVLQKRQWSKVRVA